MHESYLYGKNHERAHSVAQSFAKSYAGLGHVCATYLAAIGSVCTSRFCHSERVVYKRFFHNLITFITDMRTTRKHEVGIQQQIAKIANVVFVTELAGTVDLLQYVKNLSLVLQTVNQFPWEIEEQIQHWLDILMQLAGDLRQHKTDRTLEPTERSQGRRVPAFEYLSRHLPKIKQRKLVLYDKSTEAEVSSIDLLSSSALRTSRNNGLATTVGMDAAQEVNHALDNLAAMASKIHEVMVERTRPPDHDVAWLMRSARCLDLRKMAYETATYMSERTARPALEHLCKWLATRFDGHASTDNMPSADVVWAQFKTLCTRLRSYALCKPSEWRDQSGTVIWRTIATTESLHTDVHDYLYLFEHCAAKTMCEAVVEGMGSVIDKASRPDRHLGLEEATEEAIIAYSAPQPWHPEAREFIRHSLNDVFGGDRWDFTHHDGRVERTTPWQHGSQVKTRLHKSDKSRLPAELY